MSVRVPALLLSGWLALVGCSAGDPAGRDEPTGAAAEVHETSVKVGEQRLGGTLTTPAEGDARPIVVLLLAGSGPQDRDETIGDADNKPLRDLADALAADGIASLRYDKRTFAAPDSWTPESTVADEYLADASAAIDGLQARPELAGYAIAVVGHSQGAMLMPTVVAENPEVDAGVSLAGSPRSLFDIIFDQQAAAIRADTGNPPDQQRALIAQARDWTRRAKALTDPDDTPPPEIATVMSGPYIASLNQLHPAATARRLTVPLLFVQGEADFQVSPRKDFGAWQRVLAGHDNVTFRSYPGLNHFFFPSTGERSFKEYDAPATVDPQLTTDLADWLIRELD